MSNISQTEVFGEGRAIDRVRRVLESGTEVYNGLSEYYVNAAVKDRSTDKLSAITDMMEIFMDGKPYDYEKFPKLSGRKDVLRNTKEGQEAMSRDIQRLMEETAAEEKKQTLVRSIQNLMKNLQLTIEQAMDALSIPPDQRSMYTTLVNKK